MAKAARFRVDPKLASLLGEGYRSSEYALKELIDNAWDADASTVRVSLPDPVSGNPLTVADDGSGMTEQEVRRDYLGVASDRSSRKGNRTPGHNRLVKGRKGIGKFAGLMAADTMIVETKCRGVRTRLSIRKEDLHAGRGDLEAIDLPIETTPCHFDDHGTTVTLHDLSQNFDPPSPDRLRPLLMLEYGRQEGFTLIVNEEPVGVEDIPGETFEHTEELLTVGPVRLRFTVSDGNKPLRTHGIAIRVTGKVVGRPGTLGLEEDDEIPIKLLKKLYGELEADGLVEDLTADWGEVIENSTAYGIVRVWAAAHIKAALGRVYAQEMQLARARLSQQIQRRLAQMPEHRRPIIQDQLNRIISRMYGEKADRIETVVSVVLEALEKDHYYTVIEAIDEAKGEDIWTFATALGEFGLRDMAVMADQARRRLQFLDQLDALASNPATREVEMHKALEHNLWVLGAEFSLMSSNKTLKRVIEEYGTGKYSGSRHSQRPDLFLIRGATGGRHVLIEFKRPNQVITRDHMTQGATYRDELITRFAAIEVLLIGKAWGPEIDRGFVQVGMEVRSYADVISRARAELEWLLSQVTVEAPSLEVLSPSASLA